MSLIAALFASGPLVAQTGRITGTVTSVEGARPLAGAVVSVIGSAARAVTRPDGSYSIGGVAPGTHQLRATMLGHSAGTQTVTVGAGDAATANFTLATAAVAVEGVVAIGYGERQARDVAGSVEAVSSEDFNTGRVVSPEALIQGKVAGVQVVSSGEPGGSANLRIRGGTSVNASNEPLFVVDGVPLPPGGGLSAGRNPLNFIRPEDIERMTVLKDAASTAIYGSRGANGVVIIETKGGRSRGPRFEYSTSASSSTPVGELEMLSAAQLRTAVQQYAPGSVASLGSASTNWRDAVLRDAGGQEHAFSVSGTGDAMNYRLSMGYLNQEGVLDGSETERFSGALNYNHQLFDDRLTIRANLRAARTDDRFTPGGVLGSATVFDPTQVIRRDDGSFFEFPTNLPLSPNNPLAELALSVEEGTTFRSIANLEGRYQMPFLEGLSTTLRVGYDVGKSERRGFWPSFLRNQLENRASCRRNDGDPPCRTGTVNRSNPTETTGVIDAFANYQGVLGDDHQLDATAGYSYEESHGDYPFQQARGLETDLLGIHGFPAAQEQTTSLFVRERRLASFFGRVNYTLRDKYLLTLSVRRDGSSRFGPGNQWGTFPAAAVGWRISDEPFMSGMDFLSQLKLRASWGINGNQEIGDYLWVANYQYGDAYARPQFGNEFVTTIRPTAVDPNIKWEESTSYNLGLDYGLFNDRFTGSLEYYVKDTDDLIFDLRVPAGAYVSNHVITNVGKVRNSGVELTLDTRVLEGAFGGLNWDASFNAATNRNRLLRVDAVGGRILTGGITGAVGNFIQVLEPGEPINSFFVYEHIRGDDGKPVNSGDDLDMYVDQNDDGIINEADLRPFHDPAPDWIFGHTSQLAYRSLDLSFTLRAQLGNYVYNNLASAQGYYNAIVGAGGVVNLHGSVLDYGFVEPQYFSDIYVEDASFLKMDNLTLGYTVPRFRGVQQMRVFGTVQNVFTLTGYSGLDPEAGLNGIDFTIYPRSRTFTAGVSVGF